ncbi:hypothetical protein BDN67DRAFT_745446 [Paxillus ammoniavirescens]|nr:hypothetical protein BDN67DRAFT_745446 [Paxillus ammoniavirescens]
MQSEIEEMFNDPNIDTFSGNDLHTWDELNPDTRRFGGIFRLEVPEDVSVDCGDSTDGTEHGDSDPDAISQWAFYSEVDNLTTTTQTPSAPSADQGSTISAAQQIVARYRAINGDDNELASGHMGDNEKDLPRIPDDQRSMYTLITPGDAQSSMDMMWRPKPKIHMRHTAKEELDEAQSQALEMMRNAGLKATDRIQCRRRGCADILRGVDALKYHLHIHNIADALDFPPVDHSHEHPATADTKDIPTPPATRKPPLVDSATFNSKTFKRSHSRSKSCAVTLSKNSKSSTATPRKLSAGALLPTLFSPREPTPETQYAPSLTAVAASVISTPSRRKPPAPVFVDAVKYTALPRTPLQTLMPSRGRSARKDTIVAAVGAGYNASIAMMLSPPSSPTMDGRAVLAPQTNSPLVPPLRSAMQEGKEKCALVHANENDVFVPEEVKRSKSPARAFSPGSRTMSPARALSPIRKGLRRVLSIGCMINSGDE